MPMEASLETPVESVVSFIDGLSEEEREMFDGEFRYCVDGFLDEAGERFWAPVLMEQGSRLLYCKDLRSMREPLDREGLMEGEQDRDLVADGLECWECGYSFSGWMRVPFLGGTAMEEGGLKPGVLSDCCGVHDGISEYLFIFWVCGVKLGYGGFRGPLERSRLDRWMGGHDMDGGWQGCVGDLFGTVVIDGFGDSKE